MTRRAHVTFARLMAAGALCAAGSPFVNLHASAAIATDRPARTLAAGVDAYLNPLVMTKAFAGAVLIVRDGRTLVAKGYGLADEAQRRPNTPHTVFQLASMGKSMAAVALLQLQERGKLRISDRLCRYLPTCPGAWRPITLRNLLTHTSGISDRCCPDAGTTIAKVVNFLASEKLAFKPGTGWAYTTTEYNLLGYVIERASHERYRTYIRDHILRPLGMRDSGYMDTYAAQPYHAIGYDGGRPVPIPAFTFPPGIDSFIWGGGGLYSSIDDLRLYDAALSRPGLISSASLKAMFTPWVKTRLPLDDPPYSSHYGYGWFIDQLLGQRLESHPGGARMAWGYYMRFPDSHVTIIVLSNRQGSGPTREVIMTHLATLILGKGSE